MFAKNVIFPSTAVLLGNFAFNVDVQNKPVVPESSNFKVRVYIVSPTVFAS